MNILDFQRHYYIPRRVSLLARPILKRTNHLLACLHVPLCWSIIKLQRHENQKGTKRSLFQDFRVDTRSCEHTYDPIGFINYVHPLLPRLNSFARQIVVEAFTHWECPERKVRWSDTARKRMLLWPL